MKEVEKYLEEKVAQKSTRKIYRRDLEQFRIFLEKNFLEAREEDFTHYFQELEKTLEINSLKRKQSVLRKFYQYLLWEKKIERNPFPVVQVQKTKKEEKYKLSKEEYRELLESMEGETKLLTETLWETGAKLLDLYDLKVKNLYDYGFQKIVGHRNGRVYSYEMPKNLEKEFRDRSEQKEKEGFFFQGNRQQYDKELKKRNPNWNASKIKKEAWKYEKIDLEALRNHYFEIGIGDK